MPKSSMERPKPCIRRRVSTSSDLPRSFTELKLDRSFVDRCFEDPSRLAIIESSIELARKLGLKSVAEGVEDELTWRLLARLGCDVCQGFFSARPMPREELMGWHDSWRERLPALLGE